MNVTGIIIVCFAGQLWLSSCICYARGIAFLSLLNVSFLHCDNEKVGFHFMKMLTSQYAT